MIRPFDSDQLIAFVAVVQERGFSKAAQRLSKTQSAISQAVARLEDSIGERLFIRDGRATILTAAGRILLAHAEKILGEMEQAWTNLQLMNDLDSGELLVGTSDTLAYYLLPPVFAAFRAKYPRVELHLDNKPSPATAQRVAERSIDLGVIALPLPPGLQAGGREVADRLQITTLSPQEDVAIFSPNHLLASRSEIELNDLAPFPLLLLDCTTSSRVFIDAEFARLKIEPKVAMEMSSVELLKRLAELEFGIAIVPKLSVERETAAGTLAMAKLRGMEQTRYLGIVTPSAGTISKAANAFFEMAREILGTKPSK